MNALTCIVCPNGCRIACEQTGGVWRFSGNACKRGADYAQSELTRPMRSLTTTVRTDSAAMPALPVRTSGEIPKQRMRDAVRALSGIVVTAPKRIGDVIVPDILGLGCDIIATAELPEKTDCGGEPPGAG